MIETKNNITPAKNEQKNQFNCYIISIVLVDILAYYFCKKYTSYSDIGDSIIISCLCLFIVELGITKFANKMLNNRIFGIDLLKKKTDLKKNINTNSCDSKIAEATGVYSALTFIIGCCVLYKLLKIESLDFRVNYLASLFTITLATLLGFLDDIIDLRWRYKVIMPILSCIPLCTIYSGPTYIKLPKTLPSLFLLKTKQNWFSIDLGNYFSIYITILSVFCSNSINIYAGINGLEVGQSIIIAISSLIYNSIELLTTERQSTMIPILLSIIFIHVSIPLFLRNKYPAKLFVGDSYTAFAGTFFSSIAISGHFVKTLILFFIPQLVNIILSIPQLIKVIPCPRHRMPKLNSTGNKLEPSNNLTLINLWLYLRGNLHERQIMIELILLQIVFSIIGMIMRYLYVYVT